MNVLFLAAASEQDGHPGPVRDAIAEAVEHGVQWLRREARLAVRLHELPTDTDVDQLVFELHAIVMQTNHDLQLFQRRDTRTRAHTAISRLLGPETS
ncbi:TetR family transcriptional regulator C-terminal domain-containing protein [Rhodococcus sp. 24CO]|uniref:TetR family transcriptional regulator C-terminal domain-containing protein n=1 Tax=Rhodococcus sp. 24CO TaxID=3117460 RepID=UPI003D346E04